MMEIEVHEALDGPFGLILLCEDGTVWTNQTGGIACRRLTARGVLYNLELDEATADKIYELCDGLLGLRQKDTEIIKELNTLLSEYEMCLDPDGYTDGLGALERSQEAWLYVIHGDGDRGILVFPNGD